MAAGDESPLWYRYHITFADGATHQLDVRLNQRTLLLERPPRSARPAWTALSYHKCANCPLSEREHPTCPAAESVTELVERFGQVVSYEEVEVRVESEARTYVKRTSAQEALRSLMGLLLASSGCPVFAKLRPMVRQHLPFAQLEETWYRMLSCYLLAQYFVAHRGGTADWELRRLAGMYTQIQTADRDFHQRLAAATAEDAGVNAIATLHLFAQALSSSLGEDVRQELEPLFATYLTELAPPSHAP